MEKLPVRIGTWFLGLAITRDHLVPFPAGFQALVAYMVSAFLGPSSQALLRSCLLRAMVLADGFHLRQEPIWKLQGRGDGQRAWGQRALRKWVEILPTPRYGPCSFPYDPGAHIQVTHEARMAEVQVDSWYVHLKIVGLGLNLAAN